MEAYTTGKGLHILLHMVLQQLAGVSYHTVHSTVPPSPTHPPRGLWGFFGRLCLAFVLHFANLLQPAVL